jgi:putative oxidoreductase
MKKAVWASILTTRAPASVTLIRLMVGLVFVSEGVQKFLYSADLGPGRFAKIGFSEPAALAYLVACFEVACGALLVLGLLTRVAAVPLIMVMLTAITTTKLPMLVGHDLWGFHVHELSRYGFWTMAHQARTDWSMLLGSVFLLIAGGGRFSLDASMTRRKGSPSGPARERSAP